MKNILKIVAKGVLYLGYFLIALVGFVYLTLPLDEAKAFVIRDLSARLNADVMLDSVEVNGLSNLEVKFKGLQIHRRPTAEQQAKIEASKLAHSEWQDRKDAFEAQQLAEATTPAAQTDSDNTARKKPKKRKRRKKFREAEPDLIDGPGPVMVDEIVVKTRTVEVLSDASDGVFGNAPMSMAIDTQMLGGQATIALSFADNKEVAVEATNLDLSQILTLLNLTVYPANGVLNTNGAITLAPDKEMKGEISLSLTDGEVGPGLLHMSKDKRPGSALTLPMVRLGDLDGSIKFGKRRLTLKDLNFSGPDVEGKASGYVTMDPDKTKRRLNIPVRFKFEDKFKRKHASIRLLLGDKEFKRGTDKKTGTTHIRIKGPQDPSKWKIKGERPRSTSRGKSSKSKTRSSSRSKRGSDKKRKRSRSKKGQDSSAASTSPGVTSARDLSPKSPRTSSKKTARTQKSYPSKKTDSPPPGYPSSSAASTDSNSDDDDDSDEDNDEESEDGGDGDDDDEDVKSTRSNDDDDEEESEDD